MPGRDRLAVGVGLPPVAVPFEAVHPVPKRGSIPAEAGVDAQVLGDVVLGHPAAEPAGDPQPGRPDWMRGVWRCSRSYRPRHESPTAAPSSTTSGSTPRRRRHAATARPAGPAPTTSTFVSMAPPGRTLAAVGVARGLPRLPVMPLFSFEGRRPQVHPEAWIAPTATLVGDVVVEAGASVWYGVVLRADFGRIVVRAAPTCRTTRCCTAVPIRSPRSGRRHGRASVRRPRAVVGAEALIGNGSTVQDGARIGRRALIGAGSVVPPGAVIPDEVLALGAPARVRGPLSPGAAVWVDGNPGDLPGAGPPARGRRGRGRLMAPEWVRHAIWWQVYPLGAVGAERNALPEGAGAVPRLKQLRGWLPHLVSLGCNGLALGPVFESGTHGYDTVDHLAVDRRLGTEQDLQDLLDDCARPGIRVLFDGVFNHVGRGFAPFREVLEQGPGAPAAAWFDIDAAGSGPDGFAYRDFEGHSALVALNHGNPEVAEHVAPR